MKVYELIESSPGNTQSKALCVSLEKAKETAEELFEQLKLYLTGVEGGPDFIGGFEKELIWHNTPLPQGGRGGVLRRGVPLHHPGARGSLLVQMSVSAVWPGDLILHGGKSYLVTHVERRRRARNGPRAGVILTVRREDQATAVLTFSDDTERVERLVETRR